MPRPGPGMRGPGSYGPRRGVSAYPTGVFALAGVTRDSAGAALGGCTVKMYRTTDDVELQSTVSDGSGNYSFQVPQDAQPYYLVAYLPGAPDVAGTTVNTLKGA